MKTKQAPNPLTTFITDKNSSYVPIVQTTHALYCQKVLVVHSEDKWQHAGLLVVENKTLFNLTIILTR